MSSFFGPVAAFGDQLSTQMPPIHGLGRKFPKPMIRNQFRPWMSGSPMRA
jgi:hypothetical protein